MILKWTCDWEREKKNSPSWPAALTSELNWEISNQILIITVLRLNVWAGPISERQFELYLGIAHNWDPLPDWTESGPDSGPPSLILIFGGMKLQFIELLIKWPEPADRQQSSCGVGVKTETKTMWLPDTSRESLQVCSSDIKDVNKLSECRFVTISFIKVNFTFFMNKKQFQHQHETFHSTVFTQLKETLANKTSAAAVQSFFIHHGDTGPARPGSVQTSSARLSKQSSFSSESLVLLDVVLLETHRDPLSHLQIFLQTRLGAAGLKQQTHH